jgi:hypothetical protein
MRVRLYLAPDNFAPVPRGGLTTRVRLYLAPDNSHLCRTRHGVHTPCLHASGARCQVSAAIPANRIPATGTQFPSICSHDNTRDSHHTFSQSRSLQGLQRSATSAVSLFEQSWLLRRSRPKCSRPLTVAGGIAMHCNALPTFRC